jgi:hypothetical protein
MENEKRRGGKMEKGKRGSHLCKITNLQVANIFFSMGCP